jgi:hypothetical protein
MSLFNQHSQFPPSLLASNPIEEIKDPPQADFDRLQHHPNLHISMSNHGEGMDFSIEARCGMRSPESEVCQFEDEDDVVFEDEATHIDALLADVVDAVDEAQVSGAGDAQQRYRNRRKDRLDLLGRVLQSLPAGYKLPRKNGKTKLSNPETARQAAYAILYVPWCANERDLRSS